MYNLYKTIRGLRYESKNPRISKEASWQMFQLANALEAKYIFMVTLREEIKKNEHKHNRTR